MSLNEHLTQLVEDAVAKLPAVTRRKMFGCDAWFASGNVFALIWKEGRVGVKLIEAADFDALMRTKGAGPWQPGGKMTMSHWVLVPETMHDDAEELGRWLTRAHAQAMNAPAKSPRKAAGKPATKPAPGPMAKPAKSVGKSEAAKRSRARSASPHDRRRTPPPTRPA